MNEHVFGKDSYAKMVEKSFTSASNCATALAVIAAAAADISLPLTIRSLTISLALLLLASHPLFLLISVSSFHFVCRHNFFPLCSRCAVSNKYSVSIE